MGAYDDALVAPLDFVTAADHNLAIQWSVIEVATAADLPTDAVPGMTAVILDKFLTVQYSVAGWWPVWSTSWGALSIGQSNSVISTVTGPTTVVSADGVRDFGGGTGALPSGRILQLNAHCNYVGHSTGGGSTPRFSFYKDGSPLIEYVQAVGPEIPQFASFSQYLLVDAFETPALAFVVSADVGTVDIRGDVAPSQFWSVDIGPTGVPVAP